MEPVTEPTPASNEEVYAVFAGPIDQASVQRIFHNFGVAMGVGVKHFHLLFQSSGGVVGDGVCLYNFFRTLPIDLTLYNVGTIASAGVTAYLGAKHRKASTYATFMVHRTQSPAYAATSDRLHAMTHSVAIDDDRVEAILREHAELGDQRWATHKVADLWLSAKEAVECGMADAIDEFAPPVATRVYVI